MSREHEISNHNHEENNIEKIAKQTKRYKRYRAIGAVSTLACLFSCTLAKCTNESEMEVCALGACLIPIVTLMGVAAEEVAIRRHRNRALKIARQEARHLSQLQKDYRKGEETISASTVLWEATGGDMKKFFKKVPELRDL